MRYQRHEAPVITTDRLGAGDAIFLFQGLVSNKRAQPVVAEWFGVSVGRRHDGDDARIIPLAEVLERTGFAAGIENRGCDGVVVDAMSRHVTGAVEVGRRHMLDRRAQRGTELGGPLREELRRLEGWRRRALEQIDAREAAYCEKGQLGPRTREGLERERHDIEKRWAETERWVTMTLQTEERPYVRLGAVFVGPGGPG